MGHICILDMLRMFQTHELMNNLCGWGSSSEIMFRRLEKRTTLAVYHDAIEDSSSTVNRVTWNRMVIMSCTILLHAHDIYYDFDGHPLECDSGSHLTNLLLHFSDRAIQVTSDSLLLVSAQQEESFAEVTINASLDGNIITPIHQMVTSTDWRVLSTQVLFQAAKEIDVFSVHEWHKTTQCAL